MIALYIVLALLVLLISVLLGNTFAVSKKARKLTAANASHTEAEIETYALRLRKMIQCKTVSVKGSYDDTEFKKLRDVMQELFPLVHEKAEKMTFSDDCWIYKLEGKDKTHNIMPVSYTI